MKLSKSDHGMNDQAMFSNDQSSRTKKAKQQKPTQADFLSPDWLYHSYYVYTPSNCDLHRHQHQLVTSANIIIMYYQLFNYYWN